jgi:hypothetical protein
MKNGRIAYALAQRVPQLEAAQELREAHQTVAEEPAGSKQPFTEGAQEGGERRSWWRRWFGFE